MKKIMRLWYRLPLTATHLTNGLGDGNVIVVQNYTPGRFDKVGVSNDAVWEIAA